MRPDQTEYFPPVPRHPAAVALDEWLASPEGITCTCGKTEGQYLRNRLMRAFIAGYNASNPGSKHG